MVMTAIENTIHSLFKYKNENAVVETMTPSFPQYHINTNEFHALKEFLYFNTGIVINDNKRYLLLNRLSKRLRYLGLFNFSDYLHYINHSTSGKSEIVELIDAMTTNKTDFFREFRHFEFMTQTVLPEYLKSNPKNVPFKIWSSACSSGEEPYSIAMSLIEYSKKSPLFKFDVLATDISETVLRHCVSGIYTKDKIAPIPSALLSEYFETNGTEYKVKPSITKQVSFKKLNLLSEYQISLKYYDVIFCRNVMIYFDKATQSKIVGKHFEVLKPGGYIFIGHSETLHGMNTRFEYISPSIYRKPVDAISV